MAVCVALFDSEGKLLVTRRTKKMKYFPGAWVLPGGHLEPSEALETGGLRELMEETGVEIEIRLEESGGKTYYYQGEEIKPP